MSRIKEQAAKAPADAPEIFCTSKWGAYFRKHTATPTTLIPIKKNLKKLIFAKVL